MAEQPSHPEVPPNPLEAQSRLRSIYHALPTQDVAKARLRTSLGDRNPSNMSEGEQTEALASAVGGSLQRLESAELPRMNRMRLETLLQTMPATASFRDFLEEKVFQASILGVDREQEETNSDSFFHTLGICETDTQTEGIFSPNSTHRQAIEKSLYSIAKRELEETRRKALEALKEKDLVLVRHFVEIGEEEQERVESWKTEYSAMYGSDIEATEA